MDGSSFYNTLPSNKPPAINREWFKPQYTRNTTPEAFIEFVDRNPSGSLVDGAFLVRLGANNTKYCISVLLDKNNYRDPEAYKHILVNSDGVEQFTRQPSRNTGRILGPLHKKLYYICQLNNEYHYQFETAEHLVDMYSDPLIENLPMEHIQQKRSISSHYVLNNPRPIARLQNIWALENDRNNQKKERQRIEDKRRQDEERQREDERRREDERQREDERRREVEQRRSDDRRRQEEIRIAEEKRRKNEAARFSQESKPPPYTNSPNRGKSFDIARRTSQRPNYQAGNPSSIAAVTEGMYEDIGADTSQAMGRLNIVDQASNNTLAGEVPAARYNRTQKPVQQEIDPIDESNDLYDTVPVPVGGNTDQEEIMMIQTHIHRHNRNSYTILKVWKALYDYTSRDQSTEMSFQQGDILLQVEELRGNSPWLPCIKYDGIRSQGFGPFSRIEKRFVANTYVNEINADDFIYENQCPVANCDWQPINLAHRR